MTFIGTLTKQSIGDAVVRSLDWMSGSQGYKSHLDGGTKVLSLPLGPCMQRLEGAQEVEKVFGVRLQQ